MLNDPCPFLGLGFPPSSHHFARPSFPSLLLPRTTSRTPLYTVCPSSLSSLSQSIASTTPLPHRISHNSFHFPLFFPYPLCHQPDPQHPHNLSLFIHNVPSTGDNIPYDEDHKTWSSFSKGSLSINKNRFAIFVNFSTLFKGHS